MVRHGKSPAKRRTGRYFHLDYKEPMNHTRHKIHCIAWCDDCDKKWEDHTKAQQQAYNHAKSTGHTVHGESGFAFQYN